MTKAKRKLILDLLASFAKLERKATDEIGWISLKLSVTGFQAANLIREAKE